MSKKECIQGFSDYIFWDVDRYSIDPAVNAPFIVQRVLEYGQYEDWKHRFQNPYRTVPMLQYQTIYPATLQLLKDLQSLELLKECRLVGGTALALQLGHRNSVDLDFFGTVPETSEEILDILRENHEVTIIKESKNIHIYLIDGVKVDIVNYKYDWIGTPVKEDGILLADVKDIAAMNREFIS